MCRQNTSVHTIMCVCVCTHTSPYMAHRVMISTHQLFPISLHRPFSSPFPLFITESTLENQPVESKVQIKRSAHASLRWKSAIFQVIWELSHTISGLLFPQPRIGDNHGSMQSLVEDGTDVLKHRKQEVSKWESLLSHLFKKQIQKAGWHHYLLPKLKNSHP